MEFETGTALADERTLEALDFSTFCERLAGQTQTDRGKQYALDLDPKNSWNHAAHLVRETTEMRELLRGGFSVGRVVDPGEAVERARRGLPLTGDELRIVAIALGAVDASVRRVREGDTPTLALVTEGVRSMRALHQEIGEAIGERGEVLDRASPELGRLRREVANAGDAARARSASLARGDAMSKALQDNVVTMRDDRFVLPVKADFIGSVAGIVHDTSASGQTVFVEPFALAEANNRVRRARVAEKHEIDRILLRLAGLIAEQAGEIFHGLNVLARLDLALARARIAHATEAVEPVLVAESALHLVDARHPLLVTKAVPQSFSLDNDTRLLVISGPNMGGKTVAMKLAGLTVLAVACGFHVPATEARVGRFSHVRADVGDAQSLSLSTSTFAAHLRRLRDITAIADGGLLFLIDEIAGGTEPLAGSALAVAVLERLLVLGARGIVTTHANELKTFAHDRANVLNASMRFAVGSHEPTYELDIGTPGRSLAFDLARREGLAAEILEHADSLLASEERSYDRALADIAEARSALEDDRRKANLARLELAERTASMEAERRALEAEREAFLVQAQAKLDAALRDFVGELGRRNAAGGAGRITRGRVDLMANTLARLRGPASTGGKPDLTTFGPGDRVILATLGSEGSIIEIDRDQAVVAIGSMRMRVPTKDLRRAGRSKNPAIARIRREKSVDRGEEHVQRLGGVQLELDVRGQRFADAAPKVERWIDEAVLVGTSPIRLIHGKGTGKLGAGLQEHLRTLPSVASLRYGGENEGGSGVTILELR